MTDQPFPQQTKPPTPTTQIMNVQLEDIERAVYARDYEKSGALILQGLRRLRSGAEFIGYPLDPRVRRILYTRMASAVVTFMADPRLALSQEGFDSLLSEHSICDLLFRASAFESSDHLMAVFAAPPEPGNNKLRIKDGLSTLKFLCTQSLLSKFTPDYSQVFERNSQQIFALWIGIVSHTVTLNKLAHEQREQVLGMHGHFGNVKLTKEMLPSLSDAYMYTSYSTSPTKHNAKAMIHHLCARMMRDHGTDLPAMPKRPVRKERPTVLVCVEWFTSLHAMFRCYATLIRQLRSRYRVVALARNIAVDDASRLEFDEVYEVPEVGLTLRSMAEKVANEIKPDIIYYPSLGMEMLCVVLSSLRLAPIQVMSLGHPASSRSPEMDYVVCDEGAIGNPDLFTEKIVTYTNGSARFVMRADGDIPTPNRDPNPETVHIAVPAMLCKLNAPFMATLKEIAEKATKPVQFHFFPNVMGLTLHQAAVEMREWLPTALIYERNSYTGYMNHLAQCHLQLGTFPFGGTNSNIDCWLLGIPTVSMWGDEPHQRFDGMMQRRAGLPEWTIAKDRQHYIDAAIRLIVCHDDRNELADHLRGCDLDGIFFGDPPPDDANSFLAAFDRIYAENTEPT